MNVTGVVFTVFNMVLAVVFMLVTAPVVRYRIDIRRQIDAETAKVPDLEARIAAADKRRLEMPRQTVLAMHRVTHHVNAGVLQKVHLSGEIVKLRDRINDTQSRIKALSIALNDVRTQVAARQAEITQLNADLARVAEDSAARQNEIDDLSARLTKARSDMAETEKSIRKNYDRLVAIEMGQAPAGPTAMAGKDAATSDR